MYRLVALLVSISTLLYSCQKLGEDYPYEHLSSRYSEAYDISITLESINRTVVDEDDLLFADLQNGTSYSYLAAWGKGYDMHMALVDSFATDPDTSRFTLQGISFITTWYSDPNLWGVADPSTAFISFFPLSINKENDTLYEAFRDEYSLDYILTRQGILAGKVQYYMTADSTDGSQYYYFEALAPSARPEGRDVKGILKTDAITKSEEFGKVHLRGKVMYAY